MAAPLLLRRCNGYGAETGGPKRLLGGLYGPNSAVTPRDDLPLSVQQGEWPCLIPAEVRCRMICRCGHKGQVMELCSWHDEINYHSEAIGAKLVPTYDTIRVRGHYEEIQRRQSDFCPPCGYPNAQMSKNGIDYAALQKEWDGIGRDLSLGWAAVGYDPRYFRMPQVRALQSRRDTIGLTFDEGRRLGIVHNCKMKLEPVS